MTHLDAVQAIGFERPQLRFVPPVTEMRGDSETTDLMDKIGHFTQGRERLGHEGRTTATEITVEGLLEILDGPGVDQGPGNVRPAHGTIPHLDGEILEVDLDPEVLQLFHHLLPTSLACGARLSEIRVEGGVVGREKVGQQVQLAPGGADAELAPRDDPDPQPLAGRGGGGDAPQRVVIGEGERAQSDGMRVFGDRRGLNLPIRGRGVAMQVNVRRMRSPERSRPVATGGITPGAAPRRARSGRHRFV